MTASEEKRASGADLFARLIDLRPGELPALLLSFAFFFCVLCSYYIIRPVRDEMGVTVGRDSLQWLFTVVFLVMLAAVPVFGWIVTRFSRRRTLPIVYAFLILNLLAFWASLGGRLEGRWVAFGFFVWVSVFVLFAVSLFWSFMADRYSSEDAKRLYGPIAAGGSAGAFCGPLITQSLVHGLGVRNLLLVSAVFLTGALVCALALRGRLAPKAQSSDHSEQHPTLAAVVAGAANVWREPYLFKIALWVLLANLIGTLFYIEEQRIVAETLKQSADRVQLFARRDMAVSVLQIASQLFLTSFLMRRLGVGPCAAALPAVAVGGLLALSVAPVLVVIVAVMVLERAVAFGISNPAARVLWTVVEPDDKYKAQNFVDTVVFRGGDAASGWIVKGLASGLGLPLAAIALMGLPFAAAWLALSLRLGREQERRGRVEGLG
jgi:AAA family ATP:ADP antiporter